MSRHLITSVTIAVAAAAVAGCGAPHGSPLAPPVSATSVPMLGGGQLPKVIDLPAATSSTTKTTTTKTAETTTPTTAATTTDAATPRASATKAG